MNSTTILLRQVHPHFVENGEPTSQAFVPNKEDAGNLSVYDGDRIEPAASYVHYTETLGNRSAGVWGVTCGEVEEAGLRSAPDPLEHFPEHAVVDFTAHSAGRYRALAKKLKAKAVARGCLHAPPPPA